MTTVYLSLGSNVDNPPRQIYLACRHLNNLPQTTVSKVAKPLRTKPWGYLRQPDFINTAVKLKTRLNPLQLLRHCQSIERKLKRVKRKKWALRTIDIDIIMYGDLKLNYPQLKLPHPYYKERDFVQIPLKEIVTPQVSSPRGKHI